MKDDEFDHESEGRSPASPEEGGQDELPENTAPESSAALELAESFAEGDEASRREPGASVTEVEENEENDEVDEIIPEVSGEAANFEEHDPLAPAYDLERGEPIVKRHRGDGEELPWSSKIKSAKDFFAGEILYRFDILEREERMQLAGKYRIELKGYRGGVWTIDLGEDIEIVNRREDADVALIMQQRDFLNLVNGELNPQLAILAQKVKVSGDVRKAMNFHYLLCPGETD